MNIPSLKLNFENLFQKNFVHTLKWILLFSPTQYKITFASYLSL